VAQPARKTPCEENPLIDLVGGWNWEVRYIRIMTKTCIYTTEYGIVHAGSREHLGQVGEKRVILCEYRSTQVQYSSTVHSVRTR